MAKIKQILAHEILNSRGEPSIETTVVLNDGTVGIASSPSGISVGKYEALELRDGDTAHFQGLGVLKAIENIKNFIAPKIIGMDATKQQEIDSIIIQIDGTQNKNKLGANATLSVSMAVAKAAAKSSVLPLYLYLREFTKNEKLPLKIPIPMFNLINGGKHAGNNVNFQEFHVIPATFKTYNESLQIGTTVMRNLKDLLGKNGFPVITGEEGGFGPTLATNDDGLALLSEAISASNYRLGYDAFMGIDAAATNFCDENKYQIKDKSMRLNAQELIDFYGELVKKYHILYLEDPLAEDDWDGWSTISLKISPETMIVGDDLTVTNPYRLQMALDKKAISAIIIKPNQIGTVLEALAVVEVARIAGLKIVVSHRGAETNDDFIADFAVAVAADYVKFGAPSRGERVAKYNRLLEIEPQLATLKIKT